MMSSSLSSWQSANNYRKEGDVVYGVYQGCGFSVSEEDGGKLFVFMLSASDNRAFENLENAIAAEEGELNQGQVGDVENYLAGAPVYLDTAFALGGITPLEGYEEKLQYKENLSCDDFVRLCRKHGCDKILFATDSPWADMKEYVDFINAADLSDAEKDMIYGGNAAGIIGI